MWTFIKNLFKKNEEPGWKKIKSNPNGITVRWREKKGCVMEDYCNALWFNKSEQMYRLVWNNGKRLYICKENIIDIEVVTS